MQRQHTSECTPALSKSPCTHTQTKTHCFSSYLLKTSLGIRICCSSLPQTFICSMVSEAMTNIFSASTAGPPYIYIYNHTVHTLNSCHQLNYIYLLFQNHHYHVEVQNRKHFNNKVNKMARFNSCIYDNAASQPN